MASSYDFPGLGGTAVNNVPTVLPTPVISPATPTPQINNNLVAQYGLSSPVASTPTPAAVAATAHPVAPTPITTGGITTTETPYKLPLPPAAPDYAAALNSLPTIESLQNQQSPEQTAALGTQNTLQTRILDVLGKLGMKTQAQQDAEAKAGLPELNKSLTDVTGQIQALQKEAAAIPLMIDEKAAGTGATKRGMAPIEAGLLRRNSIKALGLSAIAQTLQGNVALAKQTADRAVALEFDPLQSQLDFLGKALEFNSADLSRADAKQLQTYQAKLKERQDILDQQKADKAQVYTIALEAAKNGADAATLNQIQASKNPAQALAASGGFLGAQFKADQAQRTFDNNIKLAQLAIDQKKSSADGAGGTYDPAQVLAYAQEYASNGKIPTGLPKGSFGVVSQVAKELPKPQGTLVSNTTGISPSNLSATQTDGITALYDLQSKIDQADALYAQFSHGLLSGVKNFVIPSQAAQQYNDLRLEISDLLARARTGAAINTNEERIYNAKLPGNFNQTFFLGGSGTQKIADLKASLAGKLNSALQINNASIYGYSKVDLGGQLYTVGQIVTNAQGESGRVNPDGTITKL